jgi:hypothetical protein
MAGDKASTAAAANSSARGRRRTRQQMEAAGVTAGGIAMVEAVADLIDARWPTRQALLAALGAEARKAGLDRRRMSKELGGRDKPRGPEWHLVTLIARGCIEDPGEQGRTLAQLAGLFCTARNVERPPGYDGPITWPSGSSRADEGTTALRDALDKVQIALHDKVNSLEEARLMYNGAYRRLGEQQEAIDQQNRQLAERQREIDAVKGQAGAWHAEVRALSAQVDTLTAQAIARDAEVAQARKDTIAQLATLEQENSRLTQEVLRQSAQTVLERAELEVAQRTIAAHERKAEALQRYDDLRERYARLAAQVERDRARTDSPSLTRRAWPDPWVLHVDASACCCRRALTAYLLTHQEHTGRSVTQIAVALDLPHARMEELLTGRAKPGHEKMRALVSALGAKLDYTWQLYDDVAVCCPPRPPTPAADAPAYIGTYESIVGAYDSDNVAVDDRGEAESGAAVALSPGDSHPPRSSRDTTASSIVAQSPVTGDTPVAELRDNSYAVLPSRTGSAVYLVGAPRPAMSERDRHAGGEVSVDGDAPMALKVFACAIMFTPGIPAVADLLGVSPGSVGVSAAAIMAGLACWAFVSMTRLARRRRYRGRHSPAVCPRAAEPVGAPCASGEDPPKSPAASDDELTISLLSTAPLPPDLIEPNLRARAQQLAQALAGRHLGIQPTSTDRDGDVRSDTTAT